MNCRLRVIIRTSGSRRVSPLSGSDEWVGGSRSRLVSQRPRSRGRPRQAASPSPGPTLPQSRCPPAPRAEERDHLRRPGLASVRSPSALFVLVALTAPPQAAREAPGMAPLQEFLRTQWIVALGHPEPLLVVAAQILATVPTKVLRGLAPLQLVELGLGCVEVLRRHLRPRLLVVRVRAAEAGGVEATLLRAPNRTGNRGCRHGLACDGQAACQRRAMGRDRAPAAPAPAASERRAAAGPEPCRAHRHPLRPEIGHPLGDAAPRNGLRVRHELLASVTRLARGGRLGAAAPGPARPSGPSERHRLEPGQPG